MLRCCTNRIRSTLNNIVVRAKRFINQHKTLFTGFLIISAVVIFIGFLYALVMIGFTQLGFDADDYKTNLYTEVFGVLFSVFVSVFIIGGFTYWRDRQQLRTRLKREARSRSNDIAISAVDWLRDKTWLTGDKGLLRHADMRDANLQGADLQEANLRGAYMKRANLKEAILAFAQIQYAWLTDAELQGAKLIDADLQGTKMWGAKLQDAWLIDANLQGVQLVNAQMDKAKLLKANLKGAIIVGANIQDAYLGFTRLPDCEMSTTGTDLGKYTNSEHPQFAETLKKINKIRKKLGYGVYPGTEA